MQGSLLTLLVAPKRSLLTLVLRPLLGLPGFHLVQPGLETLAHPPQHAGEVRVVEGNHLRAVAPPRGPRQILPLRSCKVVRGEAQPQVPVHVRALVLLGLQGVEELLELSHVGLGNLRLHPAVGQVREARVADHVARVARNHEAAGVPLVRGQGQLRRKALRLHQRLVVDHDERALWLPSSRSSGPLSGGALLLDTCSLLQPAQFFVRKRSSERPSDVERLLDEAGQRAQEVERGAEAIEETAAVAAEEGEVAVAAEGVGGACGYLGGLAEGAAALPHPGGAQHHWADL